MKNKIIFFPLGNADTTLILLANGKKILWDYANEKTEDKDDKRCDLPAELKKYVKGDYDVVCFTHLDEDHINKFSSYFYLEHAEKYQKGDRPKIKELWVSAAVIVDTNSQNDEDNILKAEARYRLRNGSGIKIFSKPDKLKDWLKKNDIDFEKVKHLIVDAGTLVPGWNKSTDGVEFFAHAPFVGHVDGDTVVDRNGSAIIVQLVFGNSKNTKFILGADGTADVWMDVVKVTRYHKHETRLEWDIFHLSHHCSYKALNGDEKGEEKTTPLDELQWLYETQGRTNCTIVSPSKQIIFEDTDQPPHFQAYNYYKEDVADEKKGVVIVTMESPNADEPQPIEIQIDDNGYKVVKGLTKAEKLAAATIIAKTSASSGNWSNG